MINGKLQPCSLDVYIAMEFGSDGDLFNLRCSSPRGPLRACVHKSRHTVGHARHRMQPSVHTALVERSYFCGSFRSGLRGIVVTNAGVK